MLFVHPCTIPVPPGRLALWCVIALFMTLPALAQNAPAVAGLVLDEAGGVIVAAQVSLLDGQGRVIALTASDGAGAFALAVVPAGTHTLRVEAADFQARTLPLVVPSPAAQTVRVVLDAGGFAERVVVTARREPMRASESPRAVTVVDGRDLERTVSADLTDVLKKSAGVDVIQFPGVLSGIGIRGFRPQFSGINKRSLLLIDGRPSGITNLGVLRLEGVERVEVLRGAASALYGSSAMGGVVNVLTRQSRGPVGGQVRIGAGSFGLTDVAGRTGGNLTPTLDFDIGGSHIDQRDDFRMGNGLTRPATSYSMYEGVVRLGLDLSPAWRLTGRAHAYRGRDIMTPGDLASGLNSQGSKDLETSTQEVRLLGRVSRHQLTLTAYRALEAGHTSNVSSFNPADTPFLPYLAFENELTWTGVQARDTWSPEQWSSLTVGVDYESVKAIGRNFTRTGARTAPFSADATKKTVGIYAEHTLTLGGGRTIVSAGSRVDHLDTATLDTPFKTNFVASVAAFTVFNPSVGVSHRLGQAVRVHASAGRAFIPAEASQLTGFTTSTVGGRTQITQGNPDLDPERSTSFDVGAEWAGDTGRFDITVFRTVVRDRFISNVVISNPAPPEPIILSVRNGLDAHLSGLELEAERRLTPALSVFGNSTHYFSRRERLLSGAQQDALNVPLHSLRIGTDVALGRLDTRLTVRHVRGAKDNNFNLPGFPIVNRDNFTVVDLSAAYRLGGPHAVSFDVNNLTDTYYYETLGYPLQGASFRLSYRVGF
jgi:vitamin B12 transporter